MKYIMITLMAFVMMIGIDADVLAQTKKELRAQRKQEKKERKIKEEAEKEKTKQAILDFVKEKSFVLEADLLMDDRMNSYNVGNNNFLMFNDDKIIIQASSPGNMGFNGLGGITIEGSLTDFEVRESKNSVSVTAQLTSSAIGHSTVILNIGLDGSARGTIKDNWGHQLTLSGPINGLANSNVFKGQSVM